MNTNIKLAVCATVAITVVGITIIEDARKNKIERKKVAKKNEENLSKLNDMLLDMKAAINVTDQFIERFDKGEYDNENAPTELDFKQQYEFEKIAVRFDK